MKQAKLSQVGQTANLISSANESLRLLLLMLRLFWCKSDENAEELTHTDRNIDFKQYRNTQYANWMIRKLERYLHHFTSLYHQPVAKLEDMRVMRCKTKVLQRYEFKLYNFTSKKLKSCVMKFGCILKQYLI